MFKFLLFLKKKCFWIGHDYETVAISTHTHNISYNESIRGVVSYLNCKRCNKRKLKILSNDYSKFKDYMVDFNGFEEILLQWKSGTNHPESEYKFHTIQIFNNDFFQAQFTDAFIQGLVEQTGMSLEEIEKNENVKKIINSIEEEVKQLHTLIKLNKNL